ncbi:MAG: hypothetical protein ACOX4D_02605 [Bacteroidales bacterium]
MLKKRFYYFFKGKNEYKIHSEFLYYFYIDCFRFVRRKQVNVQLKEIITYLENSGFKCLVKKIEDVNSLEEHSFDKESINEDSSSSCVFSDKTHSSDIDVINKGRVLIFSDINNKKSSFIKWRTMIDNFDGLIVETINFGMVFYSDKFAGQFHIIK